MYRRGGDETYQCVLYLWCTCSVKKKDIVIVTNARFFFSICKIYAWVEKKKTQLMKLLTEAGQSSNEWCYKNRLYVHILLFYFLFFSKKEKKTLKNIAVKLYFCSCDIGYIFDKSPHHLSDNHDKLYVKKTVYFSHYNWSWSEWSNWSTFKIEDIKGDSKLVFAFGNMLIYCFAKPTLPDYTGWSLLWKAGFYGLKMWCVVGLFFFCIAFKMFLYPVFTFKR